MFLFMKTKLLNDADNVLFDIGYIGKVTNYVGDAGELEVIIINDDVGSSELTDSMYSIDFDIYQYLIDEK